VVVLAYVPAVLDSVLLYHRVQVSLMGKGEEVRDEGATKNRRTTVRHAATAQLTGCGQFLTNDARVPALPGLVIGQRSELEP
jgi:hypothetical protein